MHLVETGREPAQHRTRQRRNTGGTTYHYDAGFPRRLIKSSDAEHKVARVGKVDIMHAGADAGLCHMIAAPLERTGGINQQERPLLGKQPVEIAIAIGNEA